MPREERRIRGGAQVGDHSLVRIRRTYRVGPERQIENCRLVRQARRAAQDLRQGEIVPPDEGQAIVKSPELRLELPVPELADLARPQHHEHLPGLGQQLEDTVDGT